MAENLEVRRMVLTSGGPVSGELTYPDPAPLLPAPAPLMKPGPSVLLRPGMDLPEPDTDING